MKRQKVITLILLIFLLVSTIQFQQELFEYFTENILVKFDSLKKELFEVAVLDIARNRWLSLVGF